MLAVSMMSKMTLGRNFVEGSIEPLREKIFDEKFIAPDYQNLNVVNLYSIVGKVFGIGSLLPPKISIESADFSNINKVVFFIFDGLGYNFLRNRLENSPTLFSNAKGHIMPITSTFPSTTSTALTSIFTTLTPVEHGIIGYTMYLKSFGLILDMLNFNPVYGWLPNESVMQEFVIEKDPWTAKVLEEGIDVRIFTRLSTIDSGLSKILYRGQKVSTYALATDLIVNLKKVLESSSQTLVIAYYPGYDTISHLYGPFSEEAVTEFMFFENLVKTFLYEKLDSRIRSETLFILTSDHGQAYTEKILFIKDMPEIFEQLIIPPAGDSRATFLFTKQGKVDELKSLLQNRLESFKILNSQELLDKGFYGTPKDTKEKVKVEERIGDLTTVAFGNDALLYPYSERDRERAKKGSHGGLSLDEMLVPLAVFKL